MADDVQKVLRRLRQTVSRQDADLRDLEGRIESVLTECRLAIQRLDDKMAGTMEPIRGRQFSKPPTPCGPFSAGRHYRRLLANG